MKKRLRTKITPKGIVNTFLVQKLDQKIAFLFWNNRYAWILMQLYSIFSIHLIHRGSEQLRNIIYHSSARLEKKVISSRCKAVYRFAQGREGCIICVFFSVARSGCTSASSRALFLCVRARSSRLYYGRRAWYERGELEVMWIALPVQMYNAPRQQSNEEYISALYINPWKLAGLRIQKTCL